MVVITIVLFARSRSPGEKAARDSIDHVIKNAEHLAAHE
jgi:hypothetical protein